MDIFFQLLLQRFVPSAFDDSTRALTKLHQTGTMREYQTKSKFEKLANHTKGFYDAFYRSCFISGLKDTIQSKVNMFCPNTMMEILGLAKLVEDKIRLNNAPNTLLFHSEIWFPKDIQSLQLLDPLLSSIFLKSRCGHVGKKDCYNCDGKFTRGLLNFHMLS